MAEIFALKAEDESRLHPYALKRLNDWSAEILSEVPQLGQLEINEINVDLNAYLNDDEKARGIKHRANIADWLFKCTDIDHVYSTYPYSTWVFHPMYELKQLVKTAYERKVAEVQEQERKRQEQIEAERMEKEEEKRWHAGVKAVNPPIDDAKTYLNRSGEYDEFIQATLKAIEICIEKGQEYLNDSRTFDYRWCLKKINDKKEEERQQVAAKLEAGQYNQRLNKEKTRVKALLYPIKKDLKSCFEKEIKDHRYTGENFTQFLSNEEKKAFDNTIVSLAEKNLDKRVLVDYRQFISGEHWRAYFLLPSADYSLEGVPCLDFGFDIFAVVETEIWLKPCQKTFGGYVFNLPWREEKGYSVLLQGPEFLGYDYAVFTPKDIGGYVFWQTIPLVLIMGLMNGDLEPAGTTIVEASEAGTTYEIKGFEDQVTIPESFASYMKEIGGIDQMVSMGILSRKVANIVEKRLDHSEVEQEVSLSSTKEASKCEDKVKRKTSKKAKAFELFSDEKRPSDSEVKSLGIKPESAYRYYQAWKKANNGSNNYT